MARNLQDCLAFASFKAQHGWQDRTLSTIEPEITEKLARRKRPYPEDNLDSAVSSTGSEDSSHIPRDHRDPAQSYVDARKRMRAASSSGMERMSHPTAWKEDSRLAQSSPGLNGSNDMGDAYHALQDSPMFDVPSTSDDEEHDVRMQSMHEPASSIISSSPPRTPPPARRAHTSSKQAGADLLLYLANSPRTPAVHVQHISSTSKNFPSTPPSQHGHLPSSVMQTPGNSLGLFNGALQTPGNFNLAEFCNVTPSPAQAQFSNRTPVPGRLARRGLNFDALVPPSPTTQRKPNQGLALQLGDELNPQT